MKSINFRQVPEILKKHICFFICVFIGCSAGLFGLVTGILTGIILEKIVFRFIEERKIKKILENGFYTRLSGEPFPGAIFLSGLAVLCLENAENAAFQLKETFGKNNIWDSFCRIANNTVLNKDLLAECLSSCILSAEKNKETIPLQKIFTLFTALEWLWDENKKGERPSKYLARMLNYRYLSEDVILAYKTLGLTPDSDIVEVKAAHRKLAAKFHPDKADCNQSKNYSENFLKIQSAYELILHQLS